MTSKKKLNLIRLSRTEKIGSVSFMRLMEENNQNIDLILEKIIEDGKLLVPSEEEILNEISILKIKGGKIITYLDSDYPWILKTTDGFPTVISVLGDISSFSSERNRSISIVGSRNCSIFGKKFTKYIVEELINRNFITISGLARGIDEVVHTETINSGGKTIAILGSGLDYFYPSVKLAERILENGGAVISEMPFFEKPRPQYFPRRNRIIAGLSLGTLVIEADKKSGSMITANQAAKFGRTVFAVPGFPLDDRSTGTNQLIKDGAVMVRDIDDLMEELNDVHFIQQSNIFKDNSELLTKKRLSTKQTKSLTQTDSIDEESQMESELSKELSIENCILNALNKKTEIDLNDLLQFMPEINFNSVLIAISELEIKGLVQRNPLGQFILS